MRQRKIETKEKIPLCIYYTDALNTALKLLTVGLKDNRIDRSYDDVEKTSCGECSQRSGNREIVSDECIVAIEECCY